MSEIIAKKADRDIAKNQIEVVVDEVVVRAKPANNGKTLGTIEKGIYDYLDIKVGAAGEWIKIEEDKWVFRSDNNIEILDVTVGEESDDSKSDDVNEAKPEEAVTETLSDEGVASASIEFESESEVVVKEETDQESPAEEASDDNEGSNENTAPAFKEDNKKYSLYKVGDAVKIGSFAERYVGGPVIPDKFKGTKLYVTALACGGNVVFLSSDKTGISRVGRVHARDLEKF